MKSKLTILLFLIFLGSCTSHVPYEDITEKLSKRMETLNSYKSKTTLKDLLNLDSADKIYINYPQLDFPNSHWSNEKEFLRDMKLKTKNNEKLIFSETSTSFFVIRNNEVFEQYIIKSNAIKMSPEWYSPNIAYLAGVWNSRFNKPSDSVIIYPYEKKMIVYH